MTEELKLDLMKKFKELNVAEYTTKYGDYYGLMFAGADIATKELQEENLKLEEKISVLLSCKNCPENKGGLICQKEYENKCLAQKIQYIKELQKENAELKEKLLQERETYWGKGFECAKKKYEQQLTKAKDLLKWALHSDPEHDEDFEKKWEEAEQFLNSEVENEIHKL